MPDIFLYAGEANPTDIKLTDPTVVRSSGSITGTATFAQTSDSIQATGSLTIVGTASLTESGETIGAIASESFTSTVEFVESGEKINADASELYLSEISFNESGEKISATASEDYLSISSFVESSDKVNATATVSGVTPVDITATASMVEGSEFIGANCELQSLNVVSSSFQGRTPSIYADKVVGYIPTSEEIAKRLLDDLLKQAKKEYAILEDEELALVLALALV
jgi:hypothetical protein